MFSATEISKITRPLEEKVPAPEAVIRGISIDSRQIRNGRFVVFIAFRGGRTDGHRFIRHAYDRGVRNFIVEKDLRQVPADANCWKVDSCVTALQHLAGEHRAKFDMTTIGITGSNGKTAVKEWLAQLLAPDLTVVKSPRSYNSQIGVPLSILNIRSYHELAIIEAGISGPGEMERIQRILRPDYGVLTHLGDAHDAGFESRENKLREKLKLFRGARLVVAPGYIPGLRATFEEVLPDVRLMTWGNGTDDALQVLSSDVRRESATLTIRYSGNKQTVQLPFIDTVSINNILTCLSLVYAAGFGTSELGERVGQLQPLSMRLEILPLPGNSLLVNDAYSFDVSSFKAGLQALGQHAVGNERALILSGIEIEHDADINEIVDLIKEFRIDTCFGIGGGLGELQNLLVDSCKFVAYENKLDFIRDAPWIGRNNTSYLLKGARKFSFEEITRNMTLRAHSAYLGIDLNAMLRNLQFFVSLLREETQVIAMVKAAAYGTGLVEISRFLEYHNVSRLGVAYSDEGVRLRRAGISTPILVMNSDPSAFDHLVEFNLEPVLFNADQSLKMETLCRQSRKSLRAHLKVDTGMHRLGFDATKTTSLAETLPQLTSIRILSVFTHLAAADDLDQSGFTHAQVGAFDRVYGSIADTLGYRPFRHVLSSNGIVNFPGYQYEAVRLGIGLYGLGVERASLDLEPVHSLHARISQLRRISPGESVGYGRSFVAERPMRIATVNAGYADGLPRKAGNERYSLVIGGRKAPIIGNVCMDMCMVDVTGIKDVYEGQEVEVFGAANSLEELARVCGTIPYEILTGIQPRVNRVFKFD